MDHTYIHTYSYIARREGGKLEFDTKVLLSDHQWCKTYNNKAPDLNFFSVCLSVRRIVERAMGRGMVVNSSKTKHSAYPILKHTEQLVSSRMVMGIGWSRVAR